MKKSIIGLSAILEELKRQARALGLTDAEWAQRAGIRKESLSRLRGRQSCDFATLDGLARAVGASIGVAGGSGLEFTHDALFPATFGRDDEEKLLDLCVSRRLDAAAWERLGPKFFMAGVAVMLASVSDFDRRALLDLAEQLHAGSSQVEGFALWLAHSPLRPSRFLPMLMANSRRAA